MIQKNMGTSLKKVNSNSLFHTKTSAADFDLPRMSKNKEKDSEQHMEHKSHTLFMGVL